MNNFTGHGRLTKDPESFSAKSGTTVTKFTVACEYYAGEKKTEFVNGIAFGKRGEVINEHIKKGDSIVISGPMQTEKYEKDGRTNYFTKVVINEFEFGQKARQSSPVSADNVGDDLPF